MNQNGTHNIAPESLTTLFTTLTANQQPIRIIVGTRETNPSGWAAIDIGFLSLLALLGWDGYLAVPEERQSRQEYLDWVCFQEQRQDGDDHKLLYNYHLLEEVLSAAGFIVELLEYFDERGRFYYQAGNPDQGLIKRSPRFDSRNAFYFNPTFDHQVRATFAQEYSAPHLTEYCPSSLDTYYTSIIVGAWKLS